VDRLREAARASVDAQPGLAAETSVLGDDDQRRTGGAVGQRQRRANGAGEEGKDAASAGQLRGNDSARIDQGLFRTEALGEPAPDRLGELRPAGFADERAETQIAHRRLQFRRDRQRRLAYRLADLDG
jgi:hypothetical protein